MPARSTSIASSVTSVRCRGQRLREHVTAKRLRRLRQEDLVARQRLRRCAGARPRGAARLTVSRTGSAAIAAPCAEAAAIVAAIRARR